MKEREEVFCASCEWSGDGSGLADCPVCGEPLAKIDAIADEGTKPARYPAELLTEIKPEADDLMD